MSTSDYTEDKREYDRAKGLFVCQDWLERDGYKQDAEILKRLRDYVPLARLWVLILIRREGKVSIDAYLHEGLKPPDPSKAIQYILGREPTEHEGLIIKGPFLWPDTEDEPFIPELIYGKMAQARPQTEEEAIWNENIGPEPADNPGNLAQASRET